MKIAFAQLHYTPEEFWGFRAREWVLAIRGLIGNADPGQSYSREDILDLERRVDSAWQDAGKHPGQSIR